jgi:hypothetical protein
MVGGIAMIKLLFVLLSLAYIAWGGIALHIAHDQELVEAQQLADLPLVKADIPLCVTIKNPPLIVTHPTTKNAYPRMPDNA